MKKGDRVVFVSDLGTYAPFNGEKATVRETGGGTWGIGVLFDRKISFNGRTDRVWFAHADSLQKMNADEDIADARRDLVTAIARRGLKSGGV